MAYRMRAAKVVEVQGIKFHVRTPAREFAAWEKASREFLRSLVESEELTPEAREKAEEREAELSAAAYAFVVGWEGVEDAEGEPAPFSQDALMELDVAIIQELLPLLSQSGMQVGQAIAEGKAS